MKNPLPSVKKEIATAHLFLRDNEPRDDEFLVPRISKSAHHL